MDYELRTQQTGSRLAGYANSPEEPMITLADVQAAALVTSPYIRRTPMMLSHTLNTLLGTHVYLKMELFQKTGSFKPRGAFNQMLQLDEEARQRGAHE